jgi:antitoxin component of MazEF toxin-antitoxin module
MPNTTTVNTGGNSLRITLPKDISRNLGIKKGDQIRWDMRLTTDGFMALVGIKESDIEARHKADDLAAAVAAANERNAAKEIQKSGVN